MKFDIVRQRIGNKCLIYFVRLGEARRFVYES